MAPGKGYIQAFSCSTERAGAPVPMAVRRSPSFVTACDHPPVADRELHQWDVESYVAGLDDTWNGWVGEQQAAIDQLDVFRSTHGERIAAIVAPSSLLNAREQLARTMRLSHNHFQPSFGTSVLTAVAQARALREKAIITSVECAGDAGRAFGEAVIRETEELADRHLATARQLAAATEQTHRRVFELGPPSEVSELHYRLEDALIWHVAANYHLTVAADAPDSQSMRNAAHGWDASRKNIVAVAEQILKDLGSEPPCPPAYLRGADAKSQRSRNSEARARITMVFEPTDE